MSSGHKPRRLKKVRALTEQEKLDQLFLSSQQGVKIDLGCGESKQPGWIGVDFRAMKGVDIVQDLTLFPWTKIPDECASLVMTSHVLEHINPDSPDPRLAGLIDLLLKKKLLSQSEVNAHVGEYRFLGGFIRFMDEVWRILKPGGQFMNVFPIADSPGYWQDPTHVNPISKDTLPYFDPLAKDMTSGQYYNLYYIYRPKPWKIVNCALSTAGFMEVLFEKRMIDKSYKTTSASGMHS